MPDLAPLPPIRSGPGSSANLAYDAGDAKSVLLIADPALIETGAAAQVVNGLDAEVTLFTDLPAEPKHGTLRAAAEMARSADLVVGLGGGSAMDTAKAATVIADGSGEPLDYALAKTPLPDRTRRLIMIPTTAGTGSEVTSTNIFSGPDGEKLWIWGPQTRPDLVVLDPVPLSTLPPHLTAWCGMDAFVHAFEAATNARTHTGIVPYADFAMRTIADALPRAVAHPTDLEVGADLLMASLCAGVAIENCGTAIAHALSHALAGCAPINHGLATVLAFEVTLPWLTRQNSASVLRVARSLGLQHVERLPPHVSTLMDECGIARKLPPAFKDISVSRLLEEADKPGNLPMRHTTAPQPNNADMHHFAEALLSLA